MTFIGASFFGIGTLVSSGTTALAMAQNQHEEPERTTIQLPFFVTGAMSDPVLNSCMGLTWLECKKFDDDTNSLNDNYKAYDVMYDDLKFEN